MNFFDESRPSTSKSNTESDSKVNSETKVKQDEAPKCLIHHRLAIRFPGQATLEQLEDAFFEKVQDNISKTQVPKTKAEKKDDDLINFDDDESDDFDRFRRPGVKCKVTPAEKRKRLNRRVSRQFLPKNSVILLHELKPDINFNVVETQKVPHPLFTAEAESNGVVLGRGEGPSKSLAKIEAAEVAVREMLIRTMIKLNVPEIEFNEEFIIGSFDEFPWTGIASYAIFRMFSEYRRYMNNEPVHSYPKETRVYLHFLEMFAPDNAPKKELPPDALWMHPVTLLNHLYPGLIAVELERFDCPCRVTMGYEINGKMYSAVGGNKKDAKKEAAKVVLSELHGMTYSPSPPI